MIETTSLNDQIANEIKKEILDGHLESGQKISIGDLAKKWNVSTTPVRDAIRSLESAGFLVISPRKSITIAKMDLKSFKDIFDLRIALECLAVETSLDRMPQSIIDSTFQESQSAYAKYKETGELSHLKNIDNLVHDLALHYCDNKKLGEMMEELRDLIDWSRTMVVRQPKSYEPAALEHLEIIKAFHLRNTELAVQAMRVHLKNSFERTRANWNETTNS